MELTKKEKSILLDIVKKTITAKVNNKDIPKFTVDSETLKEKEALLLL